MADTQQPVIMMSSAEMDRHALAKAAAELKANPLDVTVPGGKYISAAGETVNAHGKVISEAKADEEPAAPKGKK